ncbi:MAG TPA: Gfo/Idh/MocA family oxidoreductase [Planctomycetaceae bacterium]|nr:Gfo/Idh/MocA family oxidoreductase [Planctomycetaceae bacterium]
MGDGKVRWAVVGVGDIVRKRVAPAILRQPDSTLYACVTHHAEEKRAEITALAPRKVYSDLDATLDDPHVDAVYVATPVFLHAPQTIAALRAGKDVVVEKPMALDAAEAAEMCRAAEQTGRRLAVAYYRRFWSRFRWVKQMLDRGDLGQVVLVRLVLHSWYCPDPDAPGAWRLRAELSGGGVVSDVGSHRLDLLAWWFGLPRELTAHVATLTHSYPVEDSATVLMALTHGAQVTGSFHWNSKTWTDEIHIAGTEAKVTLHPCDGEDVVVTVGRKTERRKMPKPENGHFPLIDDFARAIVEDRSPQFTGPDGLKATRIIDAIYQSSRQRCWLPVCPAK